MSIQADLLKTENRFEAILVALLSFVFAIIAIVISIFIFYLADFDINVNDLIRYSFFEVLSSRSNMALIIFYTAPLVLTGLSVAIAFKAGLFNIGGQGQMMIGGCFAGIWAAAIVPGNSILSFLDTPILMIPLTLIIAFLGGGLWGFVPGYLKAKTGAHEVIVTILMNILAFSFVTYLVGSQTYSPFVDKSSVNAYGQTGVTTTSSQIPLIAENSSNFLSWTILIAFFAIFITQILIFQSKFGYRLRAVGLNQVAAEAAGINSDRIIILAMFVSGGLSGLAGAYFVQGFAPYRYVIGLEGTMGFDGIAVALIGQNSPFGIALAALLFGFLAHSKNTLDLNTNIPPDLIFAFQAWVILFTAAPVIATSLIKRSRAEMRKLGGNN